MFLIIYNCIFLNILTGSFVFLQCFSWPVQKKVVYLVDKGNASIDGGKSNWIDTQKTLSVSKVLLGLALS